MRKRHPSNRRQSSFGPGKRESPAPVSGDISETPEQPQTFRAKRSSDFVVLAPYLMGFHPKESLVAILFQDSSLLLTARVDLVPVDQIEDLVAQFMNVAERQSANRVILVAYSAQAELATSTLDRAIERLPFEVIDALYADGNRWWSRLCSSPDCCPDEGTPYDPVSSPVAAEAVYAGMMVAPDRHVLTRLVQGPSEEEAPDLRLLAGRFHAAVQEQPQRQRAAQLSDLVQGNLGQSDLDDETCALFAVLCVDVVVRDVAWAMMTRADAALHVDLWQQVVARTAPTYASAPICLLGMAGWLSGNGALQVCCIERMQQVNKSYRMAGLLDDINRRALEPAFWDDFAESMRGEVEGLAG